MGRKILNIGPSSSETHTNLTIFGQHIFVVVYVIYFYSRPSLLDENRNTWRIQNLSILETCKYTQGQSTHTFYVFLHQFSTKAKHLLTKKDIDILLNIYNTST